MKRIVGHTMSALLLLWSAASWADDYTDTVAKFKNGDPSGSFFADAYGYAVFPTIGKGGLVIGGAHGDGRVYKQGEYVGDTSMTAVSVGLLAGGEAYSQIIFFQNQAAFDKFTQGNFEFGADVKATAIKSTAGMSAGTTGASAGASGAGHEAQTTRKYQDGMAIFTITKGGAMGEASVGGEKFKYKPKSS
jgi:lipid-binding SYLF domain-containing protein